MNHLIINPTTLILLFIDFIFVAAHILFYILGIQWSLWNVEVDRGYPEIFQYLKWFALLFFSGLLAILKRDRALFYLTPVFLIFLVDDACSLHERFGGFIASKLSFEPAFGLRIQDYGELTVAASYSIIVLVLWVMSYRSATCVNQPIVLFSGVMILVVGFFGVVVDMLHISLSFSGPLTFVLGVIEDGGEMIAASLLLGAFVGWVLESKRQTPRNPVSESSV